MSPVLQGGKNKAEAEREADKGIQEKKEHQPGAIGNQKPSARQIQKGSWTDGTEDWASGWSRNCTASWREMPQVSCPPVQGLPLLFPLLPTLPLHTMAPRASSSLVPNYKHTPEVAVCQANLSNGRMKPGLSDGHRGGTSAFPPQATANKSWQPDTCTFPNPEKPSSLWPSQEESQLL